MSRIAAIRATRQMIEAIQQALAFHLGGNSDGIK
jgi:hypothetical protein